MKFIQKVIYLFLEVQAKVLGKNTPVGTKIQKTLHFNDAASLKISCEAEKNKIKLEQNFKLLLKKYSNNPEKLIEFVENHGTKVYKSKYSKHILKLISCEEGYIGALSGINALILNVFTSIVSGEKPCLKLKSKPLFLLTNAELNEYFMMHQFYKWYAKKLKLPGFEDETQKNFQKLMKFASDKEIKNLNISEILSIKEAIARDVEAINFVIDMATLKDGTKNVAMKIASGEGASV